MGGKESGKNQVAKAKAEKADGPAKEKKEPQPPKPKEEDRIKATNDLEDQMKELKAQLDVVQKNIEKNKEADSGRQAERQEMWARLDVIKQERDLLKHKKEEYFQILQGQRTKDRELKGMEKGFNQWSEESIDSEIRKLEHKMMTTSMNIKDEKKVMQEIKLLKAKKPEAARKERDLEVMKAETEASGPADVTNVAEALETVKEEIAVKTAAHQKLYEEISNHKKDSSQDDGFTECKKQRDEIRDKMNALREKVNHVWTEYRAAQTLFNQWEKKVRVEKRAEQEAKRQKENIEWAAAQAEKDLEKPSPHLADKILLEQTLQFCNDLLPKQAVEEAQEEKKEFAQLVEGAKILCKKADRQAEFFHAPKGRKGVKKEAKKPKSVAIKHTSQTLEVFDELKVKAPISLDQLPPVIKELEEKLAVLVKKDAEWEAERKKKIEESKALAAETKVADAAAEPAEASAEAAAEA